MGALRAGALLTLLAVLVLAVRVTAAHGRGELVSVYALSNQTLLNATIQLKTCKGETVLQAPAQPPILLLEGKEVNFSRQFSCYQNFTCVIEYPLPGNYSVNVRWLNRVIYSGMLNLGVSGSRIAANAKITFVRFFARTIDRKDIRDQSIELEVESFHLTVKNGQDVLLPFGVVKYKAQFPWISDLVFSTIGESTVTCDTRTIEVRLPLLSKLTFTLQVLGGAPAVGINGSATLLFNGTYVTSINLLQSNKIDLNNAPLGRYTLRIYLFGKSFGELQVDVTEKNNTYSLVLPIASILQLRILDARGEIVRDDTLIVKLTDPLGRHFSERLSGETITLSNALLGRYEIEIFSEKLNRALGRAFFEAKGSESIIYREVSVSIVRAKINVRAEGSRTLPGKSKLLAKYAGILLLSQYLDSPRESITGDLGYLPLGAVVQIEYSYGAFSYSTELSAGGGTLAVRVPIYDAIVKFLDLDQQPVSGCLVLLTSPYLNYAANVSGGVLWINHIPLWDLNISVKCAGVEVARKEVSIYELRTGNITVSVSVKTLKVVVKNLIGKPIAGAKVSVSVSSPSGATNLLRITGDDGVALFYYVPFPPSSNVTLQINYKGLIYLGTLSPSEGAREITLDVLVDTPLVTLTASQTFAVVVGVSALSVVFFIIARRYSRLKVAREMFASPFEEEESLLTQLKDAFRKGKKKEEEDEYPLFE